ncbi:MAG: CheR family methyltransferase, partial [Pseudomonadota bacterium]
MEEIIQNVKEELFVVGIGASAGGLDACRTLIKRLPQGPLCYVICQHLSPTHESRLTEIYARDTELPVQEIFNGLQLKASTIYVTPPNTDVEIIENHFVLYPPKDGPLPKPSVDRFFISMAEAKGEKCVAIILSGTGSDGAAGITFVHTQGGLTLAQDPHSSEYDGMPRAAIATDMVDFIEDLSSISEILSTRLKIDNEGLSIIDHTSDTYQQVLRLISRHTTIDFSGYRRTTIDRRIARRMSIKEVATIEEYHDLLKTDADEIRSFIQDAFIIVSEFMRDVKAFQNLEKEILEQISNSPRMKEYRVWVPGCATGEEAFTLAMIIEDIAVQLGRTIIYKIFATDIAKKAVETARAAEYEVTQIQKVSEKWKIEYFDRNMEKYRVKKFIRDKVVFSCHNLLVDPPFSRLDLVSCRNLLIYFNEEFQIDIMKLFNYVLTTNGILFLGSSESCKSKELFDSIDSRYQIYLKNEVEGIKPTFLPFRPLSGFSTNVNRSTQAKFDIEHHIYKKLCEVYIKNALVVDESSNLIFNHGNCEPILSKKSGIVKQSIFEIVVSSIRAELKALLFKVKQGSDPVIGSLYHLRYNETLMQILLSVHPLADQKNKLYAISFQLLPIQHKKNLSLPDSDHALLLEIEHELTATRENLQTVVEELETANEQLQVYNEELQSSNEEFQSTNEELQTLNEELQSTNEELLTVNDELNEKAIELEKLASDLTNIQDALELPMFLLNTEFRIKRFTQNCRNIVDLSAIKMNDFLFAIPWSSASFEIKSLLEETAKTGKISQRDVCIDFHHYRCTVSPFKGNNKKLDGYAVIFYETTDFTLAQQALSEEKNLAQTTLETIADGVIRIDNRGMINYFNKSVEELMEWKKSEIIDQSIFAFFKLYDEQQEVNFQEIIFNSIKDGTSYNNIKSPFLTKTRFGKDLFVEVSLAPIQKFNVTLGVVIAFRDVTERQNQMKKLLWSSKHDSLTGLVNRAEIERRIEHAIMSAKRDHSESSLLYLDLDQFKVVNDTCGHLAGDQLLKQLSMLMHDLLRGRDTLARLGGDEFAILLDKCQVADAERIAEKIKNAVANYRFSWEEKLFRVGVSIGIVSIGMDVNQVAEVLSDADAACYAAKEQGRNSIQVHSKDDFLLEKQRSQMNSVSDINEAIENDYFRLYFQKIHPLDPNEEPSWEILLRMFNKKGEFLTPDTFLPAAQRFGLIARIDLWVLKNTLDQLSKSLVNEGRAAFPKISINISPSSIGETSYITLLTKLLKEHNIDPSKIHFEITETAAISNFVRAKKFMHTIKEIGCKFSLDDFGTGMSSLSYLRDLPIDILKIDQSFICDILENEVSFAIVKSVNEV